MPQPSKPYSNSARPRGPESPRLGSPDRNDAAESRRARPQPLIAAVAWTSEERRRLLAFVRRRMGPTLLAYYEPEDVMQDVWVSEEEDRHQRKRARPRRDQLRWLYGVAHHRILRLHRDLQPRSRPRQSTALPPSCCQPLPPGDDFAGDPVWQEDRRSFARWDDWVDPIQSLPCGPMGSGQGTELTRGQATPRASVGMAAGMAGRAAGQVAGQLAGAGFDSSEGRHGVHCEHSNESMADAWAGAMEGARVVPSAAGYGSDSLDGAWPDRGWDGANGTAHAWISAPGDLGESVRMEIHRLDPLSRVNLVLRAVHGLEWATVAWVLGRGAESLRKRHARSLQTLRARLGESETGP